MRNKRGRNEYKNQLERLEKAADEVVGLIKRQSLTINEAEEVLTRAEIIIRSTTIVD